MRPGVLENPPAAAATVEVGRDDGGCTGLNAAVDPAALGAGCCLLAAGPAALTVPAGDHLLLLLRAAGPPH